MSSIHEGEDGVETSLGAQRWPITLVSTGNNSRSRSHVARLYLDFLSMESP